MIKKIILYILCLYDIYLYLPDLFDLFKLDIEPPTTDYLLYFDAAMLLIGGIVIGIMLMKTDGKFNRYLGVLMILLNVVLTSLFILKALP
jgi:Ca2+/Na+ antiporter